MEKPVEGEALKICPDWVKDDCRIEIILRKFAKLTDQTIRDAVNQWCAGGRDRDVVFAKFGEIGDWDVSRVTNMNALFSGQKDFNDDISTWDTSNVTDMRYMFYHASTFNQPLESWNVSNVAFMGHMFAYASSFNQPLSGWNIDNLKIANDMFKNCPCKNPVWHHGMNFYI